MEDSEHDDRRDIRKGLHALWGGTNLGLAPSARVAIAGKPMTVPEIKDKIRAFGELYATLRAARSELARAEAAYEAATPGIWKFMDDYRTALVARFGKNSPKLWPFGLRPAWATECQAAIATLFARYGKATRAARESAHGARGHLVLIASNDDVADGAPEGGSHGRR